MFVTMKVLLLIASVFVYVQARPGTVEDYLESMGLIAEDDPAPKAVIDPKTACVLPAQRGHCRALIVRWRYDSATKDCKEFKFGGCGGNANNFGTRKQCLKTCKGI